MSARFCIRRFPAAPVSDNSPQVREPFESLINPRALLVFIIAAIASALQRRPSGCLRQAISLRSVQSGKTSVGELGLCHASFAAIRLALDAGVALWLRRFMFRTPQILFALVAALFCARTHAAEAEEIPGRF
jgi:hypothetical protein